MTTPRSRLGRRLLAVATAGALALGALSFAVAPAQAAPPAPVPAETSGSGQPSYVDNATFTWGVSGYAQKGIFGPWRFLNPTGNATLLNGNTQTEYTAAPVPATSMPAAGGTVPTNPNAVKFTAGTGAVDPTTGAGKLSFTGSYTTNAYPANLNAPDETYTDPVLTIAADGAGTLTAGFALGAGTDMEGNPVPAQNFNRLTIAEFAAGSLSNKTVNGYRATPKYQGVAATIPADQTQQVTNCAGTWGAWPQGFITAMTGSPVGKSVAPHFYSTGCGGLQDNKPQLPIDISFTANKPSPKVTISNTHVSAVGSTTVTVSGSGFYYPLSTGTRPPLSGQNAGSYVTFGKFGEVWRPSLGTATAPSSTRKTATAGAGGLKWAVPAASTGTIGGANAGAIELNPDGTFTAQIAINKAALDAVADPANFPANARYGIYTYGGSGAVTPTLETYTPVTFFQPGTSEITLDKASYSGAFGSTVPVEVTVSGEFAPAVATGTVKLSVTPEGGSATEVATGTLTAGKATLQLPSTLAIGGGALSVSYLGDSLFAPTTKASTYTVTKIAPTVSVDKASYVGPAGTALPVVVTVAGAQGQDKPTGTVALTYTPDSGTGGSVTPVALGTDGTATISLPSTVAVGTGDLAVSYSGDALYGAGNTAAAEYEIGKIAATVTLDKTSYTGASGATIPVAVTVAGGVGDPTPTGTVTLKYTPAGGAQQTVTPVALTAGQATVNLPSTLVPGGSGALVVSYDGSATYATATKEATYAVAKATPTVALDKAAYTGTVGSTVPVAITVTGVAGQPAPTGSVTLSYTPDGGSATALPAADLVAGAATVSLPGTLAPGGGAVSVAYSGSDSYLVGSATATYTVTKKATALAITGPATVAYRTTTNYLTTLTNGASGVVKISGAGPTVTRPIVSGKANFVLPANLPAGARALKFEYAGSATNAAATSVTKVITIAKGASSTSAKVTSKWSAKKSGKLTVTVASAKGGPVPSGKVSLVLKKGSVTKTVKAKVLANGKVVLTLPKSSAGTWSVKVTYAGSSQHAASTKTYKVKVKSS